jgi:CO dehydrogenase maturation factor
MKLAIAGKGGVGKTTFAASFARRRVRNGHPVIVVDADPDGNLPSALGVSHDRIPQPIAGMRELIRERTGATDGGGMFTLNPKVDDLPSQYSIDAGGVRLLVLGTVETGGKGCMCPEGSVLKALMQHLLLRTTDDVVLDMEAGLEHMGRASARGVDAMIVIIEPGLRSVQTAVRVQRLGTDIGIRRVFAVANKIREAGDAEVLRSALGGIPLLGVLPYSTALVRADIEGRSADVQDPAFAEAVDRVSAALEEAVAAGPP